ncbi:ABC transporter substrate-binding protein [Arcobacter sp. YIC-80]|uniref:ABC transporter substrate-binding protein n=1 Tax=unclassified Arcobacter TaxID=2593671 RepID=UPI003850C10B
MIKRLPILAFIFIIIYVYFKDDIFPNKTIKVGISLPKTGVIKAWGNSVEKGATAYLNYANETNILRDKKIQLIMYDDKYEPELTIENVNRLIFDNNVYALFGFVGTPTVKNVLPLIKEQDIPFFAAFSGASFLRNDKNENIINFRSSYKQEIEKIVSYLHEEKKLDRIAVFYQNDDYGEEGYISLLESLEKRKLPLVAEGSYKRNTLSINHAFNEIKHANPQAIIMVGAYKTNALFIKKARQNKNLKDLVFCNISFGDANAMINNIKELNIDTENLIFSQIVPNYTNIKIPIIQEYQALMKKYYPKEKLGFISLEAFMATKILVNAISRIKGDITREKLILMLKNTPKDLLKGLNINYKNTQLFNKTYLFEYKNNKFKEIKW